jgi:hypothetical protein
MPGSRETWRSPFCTLVDGGRSGLVPLGAPWRQLRLGGRGEQPQALPPTGATILDTLKVAAQKHYEAAARQAPTLVGGDDGDARALSIEAYWSEEDGVANLKQLGARSCVEK